MKINHLKFENWNMEKIKKKINYSKFKKWNREKLKRKVII